MLVREYPNVGGGQGGEKGIGGNASRGGFGGKGGNSWTGDAGDGRGKRFLAGGVDGHGGVDGINGADGWAGADGDAGQFRILVDGVGDFPWRYEVEICRDTVLVRDDKGYGVLEPGARVCVEYAVKNMGGMPTPACQDVVATVVASDDMTALPQPDDRGYGAVAFPRAMAPSAVPVWMPTPVHLLLRNDEVVNVGPARRRTADVTHSLRVTRVEKELVEAEKTEVEIAFPVELSQVYGHACAVAGGFALVVVEVTNVSALPIGIDAPLQRAVQTRQVGVDFAGIEDMQGLVSRSLEVAGHVDGALVLQPSSFKVAPVEEGWSAEDCLLVDSSPGVVRPLAVLEPGGTRRIACCVRMENAPLSGGIEEGLSKMGGPVADVPFAKGALYGQALVNTVLDLGHPRETDALRSVQIQPFQVQLAARFEYVPGRSKVLLVVNNRTTQKEIQEWQSLCNRFWSEEDCVSVWNSGLYGGFSLKYVVSTGGNEASLAELFSGEDCVVVILNNLCSPTGVRTESDEEYPLLHLQQQELMHACRDFGTRVYIFGSQTGQDLEARLRVPVDASDAVEFEDESNLVLSTASVLRPDVDVSNPELSQDDSFQIPSLQLPLPRAAWMLSKLSGYLYKLSRNGRTKNKRYFCLREDELLYYAGPDDRVPKSVFTLAECSIVDIGTGLGTRGSGMDIICLQSPARELKLKELVAKRGQVVGPSLVEWRTALQSAIDNAKAASGVVRRTPPDLNWAVGSDKMCSVQVFSRHAVASLQSQAESLARRLQAVYPELQTLVVYEDGADTQFVGRTTVLNRRRVGEIVVHAGLGLYGGNVVTGWDHLSMSESEVNRMVHEQVLSARNCYGLLKSLSFSRKIHMLGACAQDGCLGPGDREAETTSLGLLVDAICSDLADENAAFRCGTVGAVDKLTSTILVKKRRSEAVDWRCRLKHLALLADPATLGSVQVGTKKFDELFRLLATCRLLIQRSLPLQELAVRVSRAGLIARASSVLVDELAMNLARAVGLERVAMLRNREGMSVDRLVAVMTKSGLYAGSSGSHQGGRIGRKDVLAIMRCQRGIGVLGADRDRGVVSPLVLRKIVFDETKARAASSSYPVLSSERAAGIVPNCLNASALAALSKLIAERV